MSSPGEQTSVTRVPGQLAGPREPRRPFFLISYFPCPPVPFPGLLFPLKGTHFLQPVWLSLLLFIKGSQPSASWAQARTAFLSLATGTGSGWRVEALCPSPSEHFEVSFWHRNQQHSGRRLLRQPGLLGGHHVRRSLPAQDGSVMFSDTKLWGLVFLFLFKFLHQV